MSFTDAQKALKTAFEAGAFFPAGKVQMENREFAPPKDRTPWAKFTFLPAQPFVASLGRIGHDQVEGVLQIDLNYELNSGEKAYSDKFEALRTLFTAGARFSYNGQVAVVRSCGRNNGRPVDGWWKVSVSIFFYAQVNR